MIIGMLMRKKVHTTSTIQNSCRQLRNSEGRRHGLLWGKVQQLIIHYQIVNPVNMHTSNVMLIELVIFVYLGIYIHICIYVATMDLKEMKECM